MLESLAPNCEAKICLIRKLLVKEAFTHIFNITYNLPTLDPIWTNSIRFAIKFNISLYSMSYAIINFKYMA